MCCAEIDVKSDCSIFVAAIFSRIGELFNFIVFVKFCVELRFSYRFFFFFYVLLSYFSVKFSTILESLYIFVWNIVHAIFYLYFYYKEMIILKDYRWLLIDFNEMEWKDVKRKYLNIFINAISFIIF